MKAAQWAPRRQWHAHIYRQTQTVLFRQCDQSEDVAGLVTPIRERVTVGEMGTKEIHSVWKRWCSWAEKCLISTAQTRVWNTSHIQKWEQIQSRKLAQHVENRKRWWDTTRDPSPGCSVSKTFDTPWVLGKEARPAVSSNPLLCNTLVINYEWKASTPRKINNYCKDLAEMTSLSKRSCICQENCWRSSCSVPGLLVDTLEATALGSMRINLQSGNISHPHYGELSVWCAFIYCVHSFEMQLWAFARLWQLNKDSSRQPAPKEIFHFISTPWCFHRS